MIYISLFVYIQILNKNLNSPNDLLKNERSSNNLQMVYGNDHNDHNR
jgi:hypothetical protein